MKIAISGASGFVGSALRAKFAAHEIISIGVKDFSKNAAEFAALIDGCNVIINLAGAPIIARWSDEYKKILHSSRINTTAKIVTAISDMQNKPKLLISTSAVGIYTNKMTNSEDDNEIADDFLGKLCQEWEAEALKAQVDGVRVVIFRFGIVLGKDGGALSKMLTPFKLGLGGIIGSGKQAFSWIHIDDLVRAYEFAIDNDTLSKAYNLTAPEPTTNEGLTKALASALHRPAFLPVPEFALKLLYSDGAKVLTDGQTAVPKRLLESGFKFSFSNIEHAIKASI
jgi:uncharacterized protein